MTVFTFHHVGMACADLDRETEQQVRWGYRREGVDFEDPVQGVRGRFLVGGGPRLELLVALPGRRVLEPWSRGGNRLYHQAYGVDDLEGGLRDLEAAGARVVVPPVGAVAFDGRRIAFVVLRTMAVVELIEGPLAVP